MRNITFLLGLFLASCSGVYAQNSYPYSIPEVSLTPTSVSTLNGLVESYSIGDADNDNVEIEISGNQNIELKANDNIYLDGQWDIAPSSSGSFYAHITPATFDLVWFEPHSPGSVPMYEKLELGVQFDATVNKAIANYIENTDPTSAKLNPFNPEDIEVSAFFQHLDPLTGQPSGVNSQAQVYGFYYREFERNLTDTDAENWNWTAKNSIDNVNSAYNFRIRFAPPQEGVWKCTVTTKINNSTVHTAKPFTFTCAPSANHGYMDIGVGDKYFSIDGQTFVPAGKNYPSPEQIYHYSADWVNYDGPEELNDNGRRFTPANYLSYLKTLEEYAETGGYYFRMMFFGSAFEIEHEHLNNYYTRMNSAWEMDRVIDLAKSKDLMISLNLQYHSTWVEHYGNDAIWNWTSTFDIPVDASNPAPLWPIANCPTCLECQVPNDLGYCYNTELGLAEPHLMLTDATAKEMYKRRLRYISSRWGYSTQIAMVELVNEVDQLGEESEMVFVPNPDPNEWGRCTTADNIVGGLPINKPYVTNKTSSGLTNGPVTQMVANWHDEMCGFLKTDQYFPILTAVSYTGPPNHVGGDDSYNSNNVDVATYNTYEGEVTLGGNNYYKIESLRTNTGLTKPVFNAEMGSTHIISECDNGISFMKNLWISPFTGAAGSGLNWFTRYGEVGIGYHSQYAAFRSFISGIDLNGTYLGSWEPQYQDRNDHKSELFCLVSQEAGMDKRAIGVVNNRTVNSYTVGESGTFCTDIGNRPNVDFRFSLPINYFEVAPNRRLKIKGMGGLKTYRVDWYAIPSLALVKTDTKVTNASGRLKLEHPELMDQLPHSGSNLAPMYAFKVRREGQPAFLTANDSVHLRNAIKAEDSFRIDALEGEQLTTWEESEALGVLDIKPNPAASLCEITFNVKISEPTIFQILDTYGKEIYSAEINKNKINLDVSNYSKGNYIIVLTIKNKRYVRKLMVH